MDRKEIQVCKELQKWFQNYNISCWLNEGENKFRTKLSQKKPDMILYSPNQKKYIAVEVKVGDVAKDLHDASKILNYYRDYMNGKIEYLIDDKIIRIDSFAIASLFSMFGKLFKNEGDPMSVDDCEDDNWKRTNKLKGLEPLWEYPRTHDYLRRTWAEWRHFREKKNLPGVGIILSNVLNKKDISFSMDRPILFDMEWETIGKPQWRVRQKLL